MQINTAYLIESTIYEKVIRGTNNENYLPEFQRANPDIFIETVEITSEIEELDGKRKEVVYNLKEMDEQEVDDDDPIYTGAVVGAWFFYGSEVEAFYEANTVKLDAIIDEYKTFLKNVLKGQ